MASDNIQNLKKGATSLIILSLLRKEDMYGYQLVQTMNDMSNGLFTLQEGSLYPVLYRLSEQGYISDRRVQVGKRMTRIYYHLEPKGIEHLETLRQDYKMISDGISLILHKCEEDKGNESHA